MKGKIVAVTGGCGFIGHHLVPQLLERGARVKIFTQSSHTLGITGHVEYYRWDMGDIDNCRRAFEGVFAVFNLAAVVSGERDALDNQALQFYHNARVQCAPAIAAFQVGVPRFLQVSSVSAYSSECSSLAVEEKAHMGTPTYSYAMAKRMGEQTVWWLYGKEKRANKAVIVRPSNMYGEYDNFGHNAHVVPVLIRKFVESDGSPVVLYGDGKGTRDLLYAGDGAAGMIAALEHGKNGRIYNLGTSGSQVVSIRQMAEKIKALLGSKSKIVFSNSTAVTDANRCIMATRARVELGWTYEVSFDEGLRRTIDWYVA